MSNILEDFKEKLERLAAEHGVEIQENDLQQSGPRTRPLPEAIIAELRMRYQRLLVEHTFECGDIIRTKPGLGVGVLSGLPLIVTQNDPEKIDELRRVRGEKRGREFVPPTLVIGYLDGDGDFIEIIADRFRFEPWPEPESENDDDPMFAEIEPAAPPVDPLAVTAYGTSVWGRGR